MRVPERLNMWLSYIVELLKHGFVQCSICKVKDSFRSSTSLISRSIANTVEFLKLFKIFTRSICVLSQLRLIFGISFFLMPPKRKSSHSFYVFLLSHHTSQASIQRISRSHTFHSPCLSDEGGNSFGCIIRPRNSISYIYRRCLSHGTKGSCQVLIEDMMVVRIFKLEF